MKFFPDTFDKIQSNSPAGDNPIHTLPERGLQFGPWAFSESNNTTEQEIGVLIGRVVVISSAISLLPDNLNGKGAIATRILSEKKQWPEILACAENPDLSVIISNKTIVKKNILKDNINAIPPFSFPGKLLAILYKRFKHFDGNALKGLIIISGEQQDNKPEILEAIVLELAHLNNLEPSFLDWIENASQFRNNYF